MIRCSIHNHTTYCDGRDSAENVIRAAIETLGRGESVRGEALTLEEFAKLADALLSCGESSGKTDAPEA